MSTSGFYVSVIILVLLCHSSHRFSLSFYLDFSWAFFSDLFEKPLLFFMSLNNSFSNGTLTFLIPYQHIQIVFLLFSWVTYLYFHWLCISFLLLCVRSRPLFSQIEFWPALSYFLNMEKKSSCAPREVAWSCEFWLYYLPGPILQNHEELNQGTISTAQAATNLNIFNELRWTNEHQVR